MRPMLLLPMLLLSVPCQCIALVLAITRGGEGWIHGLQYITSSLALEMPGCTWLLVKRKVKLDCISLHLTQYVSAVHRVWDVIYISVGSARTVSLRKSQAASNSDRLSDQAYAGKCSQPSNTRAACAFSDTVLSLRVISMSPPRGLHCLAWRVSS